VWREVVIVEGVSVEGGSVERGSMYGAPYVKKFLKRYLLNIVIYS